SRRESGMVKPGSEPSDFADGHPVKKLRPLGDVADLVSQWNRVVPAILAKNRRRTFVSGKQASEHFDGRRFAGPIVAEQGVDRAGRDIEIQVEDARRAAE